MKKVLFIAYHNSENNNVQSTALVRRISQYEDFFSKQGFQIEYIVTKNNHVKIDTWNHKTLEIQISDYFRNKILNKLYVFFIMIFWGDIIGYSFYKNRKSIHTFLEGDYHLIISFFTPRGTIWLGSHLRKKLNTTWWVDLQDSLSDGLDDITLNIGMNWLKKKLAKADQIIHVSPEWATEDKNHIEKEIVYFRHCIPELPHALGNLSSINNSPAKIIYAGNIHFEAMNPTILANPLINFHKLIKLEYAGVAPIAQILSEMNIPLTMLGRLDKRQLHECYSAADIILILAWNKPGRKVIPSKFYEACAYKKPILIVGNDTGAFQSLFEEWGHPNVINDSEDKIEDALNGFINNNYERFFCVDKCLFPVSDQISFDRFLNNRLINHS